MRDEDDFKNTAKTMFRYWLMAIAIIGTFSLTALGGVIWAVGYFSGKW